MIREDAGTLYLLGDLFDFWFEYKKVVPKGFVRLLGLLAELKDEGMDIQFFTGNHDLWMFGYFEDELGIPVHKKPIEAVHYGKQFLIGHGDGLGPGDHGYKFLKKFFTNRLCQWAFRQLHPDLSFRLAQSWSRHSRASQGQTEEFKGKEDEWLYQYCLEQSKLRKIDFFIFGHRHLPLNIELPNQSKYFNLGDWINHYSYAKFDGQKMELLYYPPI